MMPRSPGWRCVFRQPVDNGYVEAIKQIASLLRNGARALARYNRNHGFFIAFPFHAFPSATPIASQAIAATGCLRTPRPLATGELPLGGSFLLMGFEPFIPFGQSIPTVIAELAEGLAKMHL
ncbi:unnamed protein product, partial [Phaeothamnion confervicola]